MSVLPYLVSDASVLLASWERAPFVSTGLNDLSGIFSLETVEQLICSGTLPLPCVRLFRDGAALPVDRLGRLAERGAGKRERLVDGTAVLREIAAGATLVVEELQTYCPPLAGLARSLTAETGCRTYCAAFVTPPGARGVGPHYDTASVFIRQFEGSKRWRVAQPAQRWPVREWSRDQDAETEVVLEVDLAAGQCLYIPRGYIHSGATASEASAHVTVGLTAPTWSEVLRRLSDLALDDEALREALPYGFHTMDPTRLHALLTSRMATFSERLGQLAAGKEADLALERARPRAAPGIPLAGSLRSALQPENPESPHYLSHLTTPRR